MEESLIEVKSIEVEGQTVEYRFSHEGPVARFFHRDSAFLRADHPLDGIPKGILAIPLLGCLVPLSWVRNSKITAGEVDETYLACLPQVLAVMRKSYPNVRLQGSVEARPAKTAGQWSSKKYCLLFSGGIDSLTSYLRNRDKKPDLLMVRGAPDLRMTDAEFFNRSMSRFAAPLKETGGHLHVVETDLLDALDYKGIQGRVKTKEVHGWWENFAHGIFLLSMCAPFTYFNGMGRLMISSSDTARTAAPWGSMPESDQLIRWGDLEVIHDSYDYTKFEKIREVLVPLLSSDGRKGFPISVCTGKEEERLASGKLNCGRCGKCTRTILMLLENGIDPSECEFDMRGFSPRDVRIGLENGYTKIAEAPEAWGFVLDNAHEVPRDLESRYQGVNSLLSWMAKWERSPHESKLRRYSRRIAPTGSRRRELAKNLLRKQ
jgi:hypothetical protein